MLTRHASDGADFPCVLCSYLLVMMIHSSRIKRRLWRIQVSILLLSPVVIRAHQQGLFVDLHAYMCVDENGSYIYTYIHTRINTYYICMYIDTSMHLTGTYVRGCIAWAATMKGVEGCYTSNLLR